MTAQTDACILVEKLPTTQGQFIGQLTLNSPATLNALTLDMIDLMLEQLHQWQNDAAIVCVLIRGSGEKAFCAGGDVQALHRSACTDGDYAETFFEREYRLDYLLHTFPKPVIGWGHGIVMGGGLGVLAGCSHRVVTEATRLAMPEVSIGLYPDVGGSYFLNRMPGKSGLFLALTGASINATDSLYIGLADHFISQALMDNTLQQLQALAWNNDGDNSNKNNSNKNNSQLITETLNSAMSKASAALPAAVVEPHMATINRLCDQTTLPAIVEAIGALQTDNRWLNKAKDSLAYGSPLSVALIYRQLNASQGKTLKEVFNNELILSINMTRHPDFAEGVRALLVDKDRNPQWQYKQLADIPDNIATGFFKAPWEHNPLQNL